MILLSASKVRLWFNVVAVNEISSEENSNFASPSYHDESCRMVEDDPPDSPR